MPQTLVCHTYGTHIYMKLRTTNGNLGEIDVFLREQGETYSTSADNNPDLRAEIIEAFNCLY